MALVTNAESRKARRKQERQARKRKKRVEVGSEDLAAEEERQEEPAEKKLKNEPRQNERRSNDPYAHLDPDTAAAMRRDDDEIKELESKLGITDKKGKARLYREYAKLEGYGDDFGDFLDDLDVMVHRVTSAEEKELKHVSDEKPKKKGHKEKNSSNDPYSHLDAETAAAMRSDDAEIAELEAKLGLSGKKERKRLHREYTKLEGYDDDFGEFLDDLDNMVRRVIQPGTENDDELPDGNEDSSLEDEEEVPMKDPFEEEDEDGSLVDELERYQAQKIGGNDSASEQEEEASDVESVASGDESDEEAGVDEPDHDIQDTYRPSQGEDIYGNHLSGQGSGATDTKYVPPHLRTKQQEVAKDDENRAEALRQLQRTLNNSLNRLSDDTLVSVAQSVARLYPSYPTPDVNQCLWKYVMNACVSRPIVMSGMIPMYTACLAGVHVQTSDSIQLGGFLLEEIIIRLWQELATIRSNNDSEAGIDDASSKEACNLMLVLCYLYNFSVAHCSLMYDLIRNIIDHITEVDVEILLLVLSHCGHALRADDPSALKEIVLLVQKKALEGQKKGVAHSSRVEYMISAMLDLKNNKKRRQDHAFGEKTMKLRKVLGRIKSTVSANGTGRSSDACLRITLQDILNVESRGRWWKVGACWVGNQYTHKGDDSEEEEEPTMASTDSGNHTSTEEEGILKLASRQRMNTDTRRSIFCIIMGSEDCDDAFEKLVRGGMLKNHTERDTVRVLAECCGNEKTFNPFYAHLASRICDYQPKCKFTFQLSFWDTFKQFNKMKPRKAANLAKLLFHLVAVHRSLRLNVLKVIDMSPDTMPETASIFLTIFFSSIFESSESPMDVVMLFPQSRPDVAMGSTSLMENTDDGSDALREGLSVFFLQTLKSSPRNKKGSKFRANFKAAVKACETDSIESRF